MVARRLEATLALLLESTREQARLRGVIEVLTSPGVGAEAEALEVSAESARDTARERALLSELDRAMTECVSWRAQAEEVGARELALKRTVAQLSGVALGVVAGGQGGMGEVSTSPPGDKNGPPEVENSVQVEVDLGNGRAATVPLTAASDAESVAAGMVRKHGLHADALVPLAQFLRATIVGIGGPVRRGGGGTSSSSSNNNNHSPRGESRSVQSPRQGDADTTDAIETLDTTLVDSDNEDGVAPQSHRKSPPPSPTKSNARELMSQLHVERERVKMRELEVESHKAQLAQERARGARMEEEFRARLERSERGMLDKVKAERWRAMEQERVQLQQQQPPPMPQQYVVRPHSRPRAPPLHAAVPYTSELMPPNSAEVESSLQGLTEVDMRGMHVHASYHPLLPASPVPRATRDVNTMDVNSSRARAPGLGPSPSPRKQAKERFKKAVSLFDRATDLANDGYLVQAQPIYAEALSIFEALNVPELAKIRQEVQYWDDMAQRQQAAQHRAPHTVGANTAAPKASSGPPMPQAPSQAAVPEVSGRPPMPQAPSPTVPFTGGVVAPHPSPLVKPRDPHYRPTQWEAPAPAPAPVQTAHSAPRPPVPTPAAPDKTSGQSGPNESPDEFLKDLEALLDEAGA
jgi:hypothetical protein